MANFPVRRSQSAPLLRCLALPALLLAGVALLAGCKPAAVSDPKDPTFIVAEKGDMKITRSDLDKAVAEFLKQRQATPEMIGPQKMPIVETAMLRNMVLKNLLLARAESMQFTGVDTEESAELNKLKGPASQDDFEKQLKGAGLTMDDLKKKIHEKVLITKLLEKEAFTNVEPTDQEIDDIYMKNKDSFNIPEKVRASRVLIHVDDKATAADKAAKKKAIDKAHDRVAHGEDFSKVASEVSEDRSSSPKGGDLGYFQQGENEPGFDDVAFKTKVNTLSPVFETQLGYQFIKVTDVKAAGTLPVSDARGYISSKLKEMKMEQQEQAYAKKLLADSGVTYHIVLVDPPSQMAPGGPQGAPPDQGGGPQPAPPSSMPASSAATPPMTAEPPASTSTPAK